MLEKKCLADPARYSDAHDEQLALNRKQEHL